MERMHIPPAVDGSWDSMIHEFSKGKNRLLLFGDNAEESITRKLPAEETRNKRRGQRAIGVVYNPEYERFGNYVPPFLQEDMMHFCILIKHTLYIRFICKKLKKMKTFLRLSLLDCNMVFQTNE
jgi:erythromycin esterase